MKRSYILIGIFLIFIIVISVIGTIVVTGNEEVLIDDDILLIQKNREVYFSGYGYDIDNPNVIVNPYGNSPLTALVMFETDSYEEVEIVIWGKDGEDNIINKYKKDKYHVIPIYGLYVDYENKVSIKVGNVEKVITIKTENVPNDFEVDDMCKTADKMRFCSSNYHYAIDKKGNVRWLLSDNYYGKVVFTSLGKILVGSDRYTEDERTISLYEMDLLGKVYNEYLLEGDYYGMAAGKGDNYLVLSDRIIEIDAQSGMIIHDYGANDGYDYLEVKEGNVIVGKGDKYYKIDEKGIEDYDYIYTEIGYDLYISDSNYNIIPGRRLGRLKETKRDNKSVSLLKYEKGIPDFIKIVMDNDRIVVWNDSEEETYVIFDKLFDKRVYDIKKMKSINKIGLKGKYTIYFKVQDVVYKTDYYIEV